VEACRVSHDLGELPTCQVSIGPECAIGIAIDYTKAEEAVDELEVGRAWPHVPELPRAGCGCGSYRCVGSRW